MGKDLEIMYRTITIPEYKLRRWINLLGIDGKSTKKSSTKRNGGNIKWKENQSKFTIKLS